MVATDYKLENDGTCKVYAGNGGLITTFDNVDSMSHAEQLMLDYNKAEKRDRESVLSIDVKDAVIVENDDKHFDTINFMYFANNFHHDWIDSIWRPETSLHNHLYEKWRNLCTNNSYGGTANFLTFFMQLDGGNKEMLLDWIRQNYTYRLT